ncbi:MAG: chemotaxis protein CheA [Gammaproteobacteria bacterium]|nr:chemotaxis protein CheA [Gammaproteobacteria bacterium]
MNLDSALHTYIAESRELLEEMEHKLLHLEHEQDKQEHLNAIFRAAHTIKGSAGLFGLDDIVHFTHGVESLLDTLRNGSMEMNAQLTQLLLACRDHIGDLVEHMAQGNTSASDDHRVCGADLTRQLQQYGVGAHADDNNGLLPAARADASQPVIERLEAGCVENDNWHISLRFGPDLLRNGMDPMSFLRYLGSIGNIVSITTLDDAIPPADAMDPESCYLGFEISFSSDANKQTIQDAFEFVREDSHVRILPPRSRIADYIDLIQALPEEDMRLGDILVRCGSLTGTELNEALRIQESLRALEMNRPLGNIVVEGGMTSQPVLDAAIEKQSRVRENKTRENHSVRVDADKLDHLINLIGELVISSAGSAMRARTSGDAALIESFSTLTRLVEEVRDSTLCLRMVQIGSTFNRFQRVVRDISAELGKEIELVITGAETELDKTVVEKISDPLMHLVRNSIDHGIEPMDVRRAAGKPAAGILRLNAYHDSGSIVIEVSDDGAGLDRIRILQKAIERGLVSADQSLSDQEICNLIFEPGFSTAETVTNLSGRGVGMDVVRRNITALRGTVELDTKPGQGTTFRVRMPLTLAIIDGFQVGVEKSSYVVPLDMVLECVELNEADSGNAAERDYINLRGEVLPFIRMRDLFAVRGQPPRRENVVVVQYGGNKAGLVVDQLLGEFQTVIKPLGKIFSHVRGISGSTILGNGEVALIIDVPDLVQHVSTLEYQAARARA